MSTDLARMRRIFKRFHPDRIPDEYEYVDFNGLRGDSVVEPLVNEILFADQPITRLFSGGRGAGKTTELRRLEARFEGFGYTVAFMDADMSIDVNSCDFPDVLVFMSLHLLRELEDQNSRLSRFARSVESAKSKVSEALRVINPDVSLTSGEISIGVTKIGATMRQRRTGDERLREQIEALTTDTLQAFRDLVKKLEEAVKKQGGEGLILILDGTDKIIPRVIADEKGGDQQERFFVHRAAQLCEMGAHLIMAAPISLCYSAKIAGFNATAGGSPLVLPTISLRGPNREDTNAKTKGHRKFYELVEKRLGKIVESVSDVFESTALDALIDASGGSPTALMTLVRSALTRTASLPVAISTVQEVVRVEANAFFRQLSGEHFLVLKEYLSPSEKRPQTATGLDCLFYSALFEYKDQAPWFEVNPVVKTLSPLRG